MVKRVEKLVGACLSAALLAACGGSNGVFPATAMHGPNASHSTGAPHASGGGGYQVLHSFTGNPDGQNPYARLINVNGTFYGTTLNGGAYGDGTVFDITPSGTENVLYSFKGADGQNPNAALINVNGTLYGTTARGGTHNGGTVFGVTTSGAESVLYSFAGHNDGLEPQSGLTNVDGTLYSTTVAGGGSGCGNGCGTIYSITPSGTLTILYRFKANSTDGTNPYDGLINVNGTLYGTTSLGGGEYKEGTVFSVTPSGIETVLYSFNALSGDGYRPLAGLSNVNGTLYGTTYDGGASNDGTVFSVTTGGSETVLHSFGGSGSDGANPEAELHAFGGTLYGTTYAGGANNDGTVFALPIPVTEAVIHNFGASGDGTNPVAPLLEAGGTLYGTTVNGGASNAGAVYSINPTYDTESVLHSFTGNPDGQNPYGGLATRNGTLLYGTTPSGGAYGAGTIYSVTPSGSESVLQSFYTGSDGDNPVGGLLDVGSNLFGTSTRGGLYNGGTVFSVKASGKAETVLHSFGTSGDGTNPYAPLLNAGTNVYGTTSSGGAYGGGTVFAIAKSNGKETLLHSFGGGSGDGSGPQYGQLVSLGGIMYGTTLSGGANNRGTVFSIAPSGAETVLHSFGGGSGDGSSPYGGLLNVNGTLYGTTSSGGTNGKGTLFSITTYGAFAVLWNFGNGYDGVGPRSSLVDINGLLYGTTTQGGTYGNGTVFTLAL